MAPLSGGVLELDVLSLEVGHGGTTKLWLVNNECFKTVERYGFGY
tara:strand:- start:87 stop:221 length:135 start_codon:yes stop_codon:yes gene_type:complete